MKKYNLCLLVTGSRSLTDYSLLLKGVERLNIVPDVVVHGDATGADLLASRWAKENKIKEETFYADWAKEGKAAGPIRNTRMVEFAHKSCKRTIVLALWDGSSKGTFDCLRKGHAAGFKVHVEMVNVTY